MEQGVLQNRALGGTEAQCFGEEAEEAEASRIGGVAAAAGRYGRVVRQAYVPSVVLCTAM